jgi:hypothetical protein
MNQGLVPAGFFALLTLFVVGKWRPQTTNGKVANGSGCKSLFAIPQVSAIALT